MTDEARLPERIALIEGRLAFEAKQNDDRNEQIVVAVGGAIAKYFAHAIAPILARIADLEATDRQLNGRIASLDGRNDKKRDTLAKLMEMREEREASHAAIEHELLELRKEITLLRGHDGDAR